MLTLRGQGGPRRGPQLNELGIISDGAVLIRNGLIEEVGTIRRLESLAAAQGATEINAAGRVVMPGFVDSHTHLVFPLPQGADDKPWTGDAAVRSLVATTAQRLAHRSRAYLEAMARHGTTTMEAKTGCGARESAENKVLRVLKTLHRDPIDIVATFLYRPPPRDTGEEGAAADWLIDQYLPTIKRRRQARFADIQWDNNPARRSFFARYLEAARGLEFGCKIHADHPHTEGAVAMALEHSATSIDHLEHATWEEARLLAASPTVVTLLPCASFRSGRHAPARLLLDAGVAVALASDYNPCLAPSLSMQTAISLAVLQMDMTPAEAISAATINGAHALNRASRTGSLAGGKLADLLILNVNDYRDLGRQLGANLVHMTMKRGEVIYTEAKVL